ncbi:hypothetical protein H4S04_002263 [Coemansia sp. S16]|nr:hypothetical protein H4S04_002263 [Coemansia sp. S16]
MVLVFNQQRAIWLPLRSIRHQISILLSCSGYAKWDIGVHFVDNEHIQELNKTYRNKDKATDILSFPFHQVTNPEIDLPKTNLEDDMNLGDILIGPTCVPPFTSSLGLAVDDFKIPFNGLAAAGKGSWCGLVVALAQEATDDAGDAVLWLVVGDGSELLEELPNDDINLRVAGLIADATADRPAGG